MALDPAERIRRGRHLLLLGTVGVVGGTALASPVVAWIGVVVTAVGLASSTAGKAVHFRGLPIRAVEWGALLATWVALAILATAVFATIVGSSFAGLEGGLFWPLALAAAAVAVLHRQLQVRFLSAVEGVEPGEYGVRSTDGGNDDGNDDDGEGGGSGTESDGGDEDDDNVGEDDGDDDGVDDEDDEGDD